MAGSASARNEPNPHERLVRVFDTEQESEAMIVKGLLESADIDADMTALDASGHFSRGRWHDHPGARRTS